MESIFSALLSLLLLEADAKVFVVEHLFDCFFAPRVRTAAAAAAAEGTTSDAEEEDEAIIVVAVAVVITMLPSFLCVARVSSSK